MVSSLTIHMKIQSKKTEMIDTAENNSKISRPVYQFLFVNISDSFIEYIHSLSAGEIQELDME